MAWGRLEQTFARPDYAKYGGGFAEGVAVLDDSAMEFGQLYRSSAVLGAGPELPAAARPDQWAGQPGTRAPHWWLEKAGDRVSTLDLLERGWLLMTEEQRWLDAAPKVGAALGIAVATAQVGVDFAPDDLPGFRAAFGIGSSGASLIRPDGFIAWRSVDVPADPTRALHDALAAVSSATRAPSLALPPARLH